MSEQQKPRSSKFLCQASWADAPHLTEQAKAELLAAIPEYQRDARSKGIPELGSGLVYRVAPVDVTVSDFQIPKHWPKAYGLDIGWNWTAAVWGAWNQETDVVYLWSVYKRGQSEPSVHADGVKARGAWIPGVIDPAAFGSNQIDGRKAIELYRQFGLNVEPAENAVESGIYEVWQRLSSGRLKVFESLQEWFYEYGKYQRDTRGRIRKIDDHLMDATRYLIVSGLHRAVHEPKPEEQQLEYVTGGGADVSLGWLGA